MLSVDKFTEIAQHMFDVLRTPDTLRDDLTVIFLTHSEEVSANGYTKTKMKTIGKMLDDKITIEGMFTIVLATTCYSEKVDDKDVMRYVFITKTNGTNTVKSPDGMFDKKVIPNDLGYVLKKIEEYNNG